jgi:tetratricopeptide (TPR) repeat protein
MNWAPLRGIHTADWMYVRAPKPELYDLKNDPAELHNVIDAHPKEYRDLDKQLKLLIGNNGTETVVSQQMDQQTAERLRSLGYLGGSSQQSASLDSTGADPKDQVEILKLLHLAKDTPASEMSSSRRIELYREALEKDPSNPALYYALGDEYEKTGQNEANMQLCLDALHHGVAEPMILSRLGELYLSKGEAKQAIAYYEPAVQMDPTDIGTINGLGSAYSANGQLAEATVEFQRALAIEPYIPAYNGLGLVEVKHQDFLAARRNFERAIQMDPKDAESQLNLGVLCMQTGDAPCGRAAFHAFLANASPVQYRDMIPRVQYALRTVLATKP